MPSQKVRSGPSRALPCDVAGGLAPGKQPPRDLSRLTTRQTFSPPIASAGRDGTGSVVPNNVPPLRNPLRARNVSDRPDLNLRAPAREISRASTRFAKFASADPITVATLDGKRRLRIGAFLSAAGVPPARLAVTALTDGCIELACSDLVEPGLLADLVVDGEGRYRVPVALVVRLGVSPGAAILVTCNQEQGRVVLLNPALLADLLESSHSQERSA